MTAAKHKTAATTNYHSTLWANAIGSHGLKRTKAFSGAFGDIRMTALFLQGRWRCDVTYEKDGHTEEAIDDDENLNHAALSALNAAMDMWGKYSGK